MCNVVSAFKSWLDAYGQAWMNRNPVTSWRTRLRREWRRGRFAPCPTTPAASRFIPSQLLKRLTDIPRCHPGSLLQFDQAHIRVRLHQSVQLIPCRLFAGAIVDHNEVVIFIEDGLRPA